MRVHRVGFHYGWLVLVLLGIDTTVASARDRVSITQKASGAVEVTGRMPEGTFEKTVHSDGRSVLRVSRPGDRLEITMSAQRIVVTRNGQSASLDVKKASLAQLDSVRDLLGGSRAVRALYEMPSAVRQENTYAADAFAISATLVAWLAGDAQPGRFLTARLRQPSTPVLHLTRQGTGCYSQYEAEVTRAWNEQADCLSSIAWWNPVRELCRVRWFVQIESAWFSLFSCIGFGLK